ncbi:helix-turn-helix domain-containing protein [Pseudonocardia zijingensis]|uniref:helix-turn-helix domain-containing protein n=1 Tax=Pseudonocardia zijingensis TaxID=153376 RepID=UPI0031D3700B
MFFTLQRTPRARLSFRGHAPQAPRATAVGRSVRAVHRLLREPPPLRLGLRPAARSSRTPYLQTKPTRTCTLSTRAESLRLTRTDERTYRPGVAADRLLTTGELARELGLSARSIARWAQEGKLQPTLVTPGGQYRWQSEDVREQLRQLRTRRD